MGRETLFEYLSARQGYEIHGDRLRRPDGSVAATLEKETWRPMPTGDEMRDYMLETHRGLPSMLVDSDLTNPGHGAVSHSQESRGPTPPSQFAETFDNPLYKARIMRDALTAILNRRK